MTDNRTTELLRELRDLAADVNPSEIVDHVEITSRGWTFNAQWLDSWHAEFDRITDKLEQAITATLGSGTSSSEAANPQVRCTDFKRNAPVRDREDSHTLLPCPFCGGEAETHEVTIPYHYWDVWCDGECFDHFCERPTEADAVAAWNTRATHGTLTAEQVREAIKRHVKFYEGGDYDEQAIADELNGLFGSRTCEMETDWDYLHDGIPDAPEDTWAYMCSACEWSFRYDRGIKPTYCPNCGAKVIGG